jgi:hypothetical protein
MIAVVILLGIILMIDLYIINNQKEEIKAGEDAYRALAKKYREVRKA